MKTIDLAIVASGIVMLLCAYEFRSVGMAIIAACSFILASFSKESYSQVEKPLRGHIGDDND